MEVSDAKRLKALEAENARLKRMVADLSLEVQMLKDINSKKTVKPAARREAVGYLRKQYSTSERRACRWRSKSISRCRRCAWSACSTSSSKSADCQS
jgi:hypothetical protein